MHPSNKILNMYLATHKTCNMLCSYCYIPEKNRTEKKVKDSQIITSLIKYIDKVEKEGFAIGKFCLHGAEPSLLAPESVVDIVNQINKHWKKKNISGSHEVSIQ